MPALYFAPSYFAPSYFTSLAPISGITPQLTGQPASLVLMHRHMRFQYVPSPDFWTAVVTWFRNDTDITNVFPGGISHGPVQPSTPLPYARIIQQDVATSITLEDSLERAIFEVYGNDDDITKGASDFLANKLNNTASRLPFAFGGYSETAHKPFASGKPQFVQYIGSGVPLWQCSFTFIFWVRLIDPTDTNLAW